MAAEPKILPSSRRLGEYLDCAPQALQAALTRQSTQRAGGPWKRIGELLLEDEAISLDALLAGIQSQRIERLRACPLFASLSHDDLAELSAVFQEVTVNPDQRFITQDDRDPFLYVLASGRLEVFRTDDGYKDTVLARVFPGEPVGEMGYFTNGVRSASVRALETVQLLRASYQDLTDCFETNANVATAFMDVVTHRLRKTNLLYQENQYRRPASNRRLSHLADFIEFPKASALEQGIDTSLERLVQGLARLTDAERVILYLVDPKTGDLWSRIGEGIESRDIRVSMSEGIIGWVARNAQLANVADAHADKRFDRDLDRRTGTRTHTVLCAPVLGKRKELVGVLEVGNKRIGIFDETDEGIARVFAEEAAVAAECSNLYRDVVRSHERMAILLDLATVICEAGDVAAMMKTLGRELPEVLGCERVQLFALDKEAQEVWTCVPRDEGIEELRVAVSSAVAGYAAVNGEVVNISDAYGDQRFNPEFDRLSGFRTRNVLCVPVVGRRGQVAGALQADNKIEGRFSEEDVRVMRAMAAQIGVSAMFAP